MKEINLFQDGRGSWLTNIDLFNMLKELEADKCEILYIHSSLSFGMPNPELKKKQLLEEICKVLDELHVPTLVMPTFTFSYCNGKVYDRDNSKCKMGALNEYFRKREGVIRSVDPLMSVAVKGVDKDLALGITTHSIGDNSTFDKLRHRENVKFLFLGTRIGDCFTYMHYLEWLYGVPYRYDRRFVGTSIIDGNEVRSEYDLFVRHYNVLPNDKSYEYEEKMYADGKAFRKTFGDSTISIVEEKTGADEYRKCLLKNPNYFVDYVEGEFTPNKTFVLTKEMVAL